MRGPPTLVSLCPELLVEISSWLPPFAVIPFRQTCTHVSAVLMEHEEYICGRIASTYCTLTSYSVSGLHANMCVEEEIEAASPGSEKQMRKAISPTQELQQLAQEHRLSAYLMDCLLPRHIPPPEAPSARLISALPPASTTPTGQMLPPEQQLALRRGLPLLWVYWHAAEADLYPFNLRLFSSLSNMAKPRASSRSHRLAFLACPSLSASSLDSLWLTSLILSELLIAAACPTYWDEEWDDEGRALTGLDPVYFSFVESVLFGGVAWLVNAVDACWKHGSESLAQKQENERPPDIDWGGWKTWKSRLGKETNANVALIREERRRRKTEGKKAIEVVVKPVLLGL